jgi:exopolyphosphatase / guanosine-5'-triphosphate,3'-diphosphate pyrophosphatase
VTVRVAVVDIGTNSTRLLIADVADGRLEEVDRRTTVTRLGEGVEATGRLGEAPQARVRAVLEEYTEAIERRQCDLRVAVLTSAVRDAANGRAFTDEVRSRFELDARTLSGDEEARLTYLGATAARDPEDPTARVVIDIGGGSTELVIGARGRVEFHVSTQAGVVRHTERYLASDPPAPAELEELAADVRAVLEAAVPAAQRDRPEAAVAVAGTATSSAAIDLELDPYDPGQVEGHVLSQRRLGELLSRLAAMPLADRRRVVGLHPDRAPTIVAGVVILATVLRFLRLPATEVSERDILWGAALDAATR